MSDIDQRPVEPEVHQPTPSAVDVGHSAPGAGVSMLGAASTSLGGRVMQRKLSRRIQRRAADHNGVMDGAAEKVESAASSSGSPLPGTLQRKFEGSLGADLSGVRVHTGEKSAQAAESVSARAYTVGSDIHFGAGQYNPSSSDGQHLIAHEVAHTVQQGRGGGGAAGGGAQFKLEVSEPGDAHEAEADRAADAMVAGRSAVIGSAPAGAARKIMRDALGGNPADLPQTANHPGTTHAAPTINDAANHQQPTAAAGAENRATNVKVLRDESNPLSTGPNPVCPNPAAIYQESNTAQAGFTAVDGFRGTTDAPLVEEEADNSLYINNQPTADDVQQYQIGDCYWLATLISVVSRDPGKIKSMISSDGSGGASITFYRKQVDQPNWFSRLFGGQPTVTYPQVTISVSNQLAFRRSRAAGAGPTDRESNGRGGFTPNGAQLRAGQQPTNMAWYGKIQAPKMEVHRKDTFQMARWAPLMEKAFARYTEQYGQYGGTHPESAHTGGQGYQNINGGVSMYTMMMFYGAAADNESNGTNAGQVERVNGTWSPGANLLMANQQVIDRLLRLRGKADTRQPGENTANIMTASAFTGDQIPRTALAITAAQGDADWANVAAQAQADVTALQTAITAWTATPATPVPAKQAAMSAVGNAAKTAADPARNPSLHDNARSRPIKQLLELMACIRNAGTDNSGGQRNIYGDHSYAVLSVSFVTSTGQPVALEAAPFNTRPALFPLVDTNLSKVRLRNPHHTNIPDIHAANTAHGGAPDAASDNGVFEQSIEQFFLTFSCVDAGVFPAT